MNENQQAVLGFFIILGFIAVPVLIAMLVIKLQGGVAAVVRKPHVRRMETAILMGQNDADYTQEAVENLQRKGLL